MRDAEWPAVIRQAPTVVALTLMLGSLGACQDAPITADQLEPDGTLREYSRPQAAFSAEVPPEELRQAVHVSAVLAAQDGGALEDRNTFPADVGTIHLHVRADGLFRPRSVIYRWSFESDGIAITVPGELAPGEPMSLGSSFDIDPEHAGRWTVDVFTVGEEPTRNLFHREFVIEPPPADTPS